VVGRPRRVKDVQVENFAGVPPVVEGLPCVCGKKHLDCIRIPGVDNVNTPAHHCGLANPPGTQSIEHPFQPGPHQPIERQF